MIKRLISAGLLMVALGGSAAAQTRISDVTVHDGEVPMRLVGYGIVTGLNGTGDRSFGNSSGSVHTVQSVANLLRRFNVEVPAERLRLRNVAAVLVTAEVSPWLRPGGRFDVQVSSLGDATSLAGGSLWITPLVTDPDGPSLATAQGIVPSSQDESGGRSWRAPKGGSGRITDAGVLEVSAATGPKSTTLRLSLRQPDLGLAVRIAGAIKKVHGDSSAKADDPGSITLKSPAAFADNPQGFLAAVDTLPVEMVQASRIVIDARTGIVAAGGDMRVGRSVVSLRGITVRVQASKSDSAAAVPGLVSLTDGATVQDVAAGLQALGVQPAEVAAVFDALRAAGAIRATVVVR